MAKNATNTKRKGLKTMKENTIIINTQTTLIWKTEESLDVEKQKKIFADAVKDALEKMLLPDDVNVLSVQLFEMDIPEE